MWLLIAFIAVPMIEISLFIQVGGVIGLGWTLAIVVATAVAGSWLVRQQGLRALAELRGSLADLKNPTEPIAHGAMILFAGALLLTPGFFTDTVGLLLLVPPVRAALLRYLSTKVQVASFTVGGGATPRQEWQAGDVIDAEYSEIDPRDAPRRPTDGITRH